MLGCGETPKQQVGPELEGLGVQMVGPGQLGELLREADVVVNALPSTKQTVGLLENEALRVSERFIMGMSC